MRADINTTRSKTVQRSRLEGRGVPRWVSLEAQHAVEIDAKAVPIVIGKGTDPATDHVAAGEAPERPDTDGGTVLQPHGGVERAGTETVPARTKRNLTLRT